MPRSAGIGDDVADVAFAGHEHEQALEAEAEARVRDGTETTRVDIPAIAFQVEAMGLHRRDQAVQTFFALAAADDLADAGHEHVHRGDGLPIVVLAHVEGLGGFRVIVHGHRALEVLLGEVTLMLGLQVLAPDDGVFELTAGLQKQVDGLRVGDAGERTLRDETQALEQAFVDESIEERELVGALC